MAYNNGLLNFGDSIVEVGYNNENYTVDKAQIVEKDGTVHELGGGGGGGDYPILTGTWQEDIENYTYSCNWSFAELKAKLQEQTQSNSWAGVALYADQDGTHGGSWSMSSETRLTFLIGGNWEFFYNSDGTIEEGII